MDCELLSRGSHEHLDHECSLGSKAPKGVLQVRSGKGDASAIVAIGHHCKRNKETNETKVDADHERGNLVDALEELDGDGDPRNDAQHRAKKEPVETISGFQLVARVLTQHIRQHYHKGLNVFVGDLGELCYRV